MKESIFSLCPACRKNSLLEQRNNKYCFSCGFVEEVEEVTEPPKILQEAAALMHSRYYKCEYKRNIKKSVADDLCIGYDDGYLAEKLLKKYSREECLNSGLVGEFEGRLYDRFFKRLIFPIRDADGRVIAFGGRRTTDTDTAKYLNSRESDWFKKRVSLYGIEHVSGPHLYIVEGYMDCLAIYQAGEKNVSACLGTAVGTGHIKILRDCGVTDVTLCLDSDEAGQKATLRAIEVLKDNFNVNVLVIPGAKDADEYLAEHSLKEFKALPTKSWQEYVSKKGITADVLLSLI